MTHPRAILVCPVADAPPDESAGLPGFDTRLLVVPMLLSLPLPRRFVHAPEEQPMVAGCWRRWTRRTKAMSGMALVVVSAIWPAREALDIWESVSRTEPSLRVS